jgi:hypothetical protein
MAQLWENPADRARKVWPQEAALGVEVSPVAPLPSLPLLRPQQNAWPPVVTPQVWDCPAEIEAQVWPPVIWTGWAE